MSYYYFEIDSAAANDDDLDDLLENFQGKVEALNTAEIAFIGSVAKATREVVLALGIGSVPAPGTKVTAATILKAAGIEAGVAFTAGVVVFEACEAAYDVYFDIFVNRMAESKMYRSKTRKMTIDIRLFFMSSYP